MALATTPLSDTAAAFLRSGPTRLLIGGDWVEAADSGTFDTINPATGQVLMACASGQAQDIDRAVRAARQALEGPWKRVSPADRGLMLWRLADLIEQHAGPLAEIETLDNGKPFAHARDDDIALVVAQLRYYAGWTTKIEGQTIPVSTDPDHFNFTLREPVGVVGAIVPWNYPLQMAVWKLAPALACGNVCIVKPAEQTPLTAIWLGRLALEAGFPPGVVSVITGYGETAGAALSAHPDVDLLVFTGSTEVGRAIVAASAGNLKRVALELGGKSPNIICADADLDKAIAGAANAVFYNMGQDCSAGTRVFVAEEVHDAVVEGLAREADSRTIGNGLAPGVDQGPLVSEEQLDKVLAYLSAGEQEGAHLVTGGARATGDGLDRGFFVRPTVFGGVANDMKIAREEIFGPVVVVLPFSKVEDAVRMGNATRYGLGAGVWTRDVRTAHRAARELKAGTVWVNCYNVADPASPFGGYKESGYGRDLGRDSIDVYTQVKSVWIDFG
jgi:acyl-CoA reductase-like NAD-dependent aldehyde dehydrogenase